MPTAKPSTAATTGLVAPSRSRRGNPWRRGRRISADGGEIADVVAAGEAAAGAGHDDGADRRRRPRRAAKAVDQPEIAGAVERVLALGPVHGDLQDAGRHGFGQNGGGHRQPHPRGFLGRPTARARRRRADARRTALDAIRADCVGVRRAWRRSPWRRG